MSTRCAKVLIEGGPQRRFGYFAAVGKGTRPAGRNQINIKNVGATKRVVPTFLFITGAEAKRSFAESSFAYFSYKKRRSRKK